MSYDYEEFDDDNTMDYRFSTNRKSYFNDDEDDDFADDAKLMKSMDGDLAGYFSDARVFAPKKSAAQKKAKKPQPYKNGEKVIVNGKEGTVVYGPYEVNKKKMYEIELVDGDLISTDDKHISPVECK